MSDFTVQSLIQHFIGILPTATVLGNIF